MKLKYKFNSEKMHSERLPIYKLIDHKPKQIIDHDELIRFAAELSSIPANVILSNIRLPEVVIVRYTIFHILRHKFKYGLKHIGRIMNRDHSTVVYGLAECNKWAEMSKHFYIQVRIFKHITSRCIINNEDDITVITTDLKNKIEQSISDIRRYRAMLNEINNLNTVGV